MLLLSSLWSIGILFPSTSVAQVGPDSSYVRPAYERGDAQLRLISTTGTLGVSQGAILVTGALLASDASVEFDEYVGSVFGGMLVGGAVGTVVPLIATRNTTVRRDAATLTAYGGVQGYAHAVELLHLLGGDEGLPASSASFVIAGFGAAQATVGYAVGQRWNAYAGTSEMLAVTGTAGHLIGYGVTRGLGAPRVDASTDADERLYAGGALAGSLLGMWTGYRLGQTGQYTTGDARLYALSGLVGAGIGAASSGLSTNASVRRDVAFTAAGAAVGLSTGAILGRSYDLTPSEGNIIASAGLLTGSLFGAIGQAAFTGPDGDESPAANLLMLSLGTAVGAGVTLSFLAGDARERAGRQKKAGSQPKTSSSAARLDVNVSPYVPSGPQPANASPSRLRPMLNLTLSF